MNLPIRLAAVLVACAISAGAFAQLRSIPGDAKPGEMRHLHDMIVEVNGKAVRLSPGAQIRDAFNRLVLPTTLADRKEVKYLPDASGMVYRVWILSKEEAAQVPRLLPAPASR